MAPQDVARVRAINEALRNWRQGDIALQADLHFIHLANLSLPLSKVSEAGKAFQDNAGNSIKAVGERTREAVMLTQTCDVIRDCSKRPFVAVAPLVERSPREVEEIRLLKRPSFAYIPSVANRHLVADLDRVMTVEKTVVASWNRKPGWESDEEGRAFARAVGRKYERFAFPDDFTSAADKLRKRLVKHHKKNDSEGTHLKALREIRVRAYPSWDDSSKVQIDWWFIRHSEPRRHKSDPNAWAKRWLNLFDDSGRFHIGSFFVCGMADISAQTYIESVPLDLEDLSVKR